MSNVDLAHKTILVTGAAGFIGANLSQRLLDEVEDVKVIGLHATDKPVVANYQNTGKKAA